MSRTDLQSVNGLHHITAIAGPPQENLDFYAGVLGMHLVKKSVNQDDPGTYHLFYADAEGHPGADLTFFPWAEMAPPRLGHGLAVEVSLEVPDGSLEFWGSRLEKYGTPLGSIEHRFGDRVLPLVDPHGMKVALVESASARPRLFSPWDGSPVPVARQIRGLYGAQLWERESRHTTDFLTGVLGFQHLATENGWLRYGFPGVSGVVDVREVPEGRRGAWGVGCVHHLAWRVDDEAHQLAVQGPRGIGRRSPDAGDRSVLVQVGLFQGARRRAVRARDRRSRVLRGRGSCAPWREVWCCLPGWSRTVAISKVCCLP